MGTSPMIKSTYLEKAPVWGWNGGVKSLHAT